MKMRFIDFLYIVKYVPEVETKRTDLDPVQNRTGPLKTANIPQKMIFFKVGRPGQLGKELLGLVHQSLEFLRHFLVHHGHKPPELAPQAGWVAVGLDEADVGLHDGPLVLDPIAGAILPSWRRVGLADTAWLSDSVLLQI